MQSQSENLKLNQVKMNFMVHYGLWQLWL